MSHVNNMHTWMTPEDFDEAERVLHKSGGDAAYKAELRCIRRRQDQHRAAVKLEHERVQVPLFALALCLLFTLTGCTALARAQALQGVAVASSTVGCIAEAAGLPWGAPLCRAAQWLADHSAKRIDEFTPESASLAEVELEAAAAELQDALDLCDPDGPTPEQVADVVAAQAVVDGLEAVTP